MRATDHLLTTLEKGHLEPEVRVVTNNAGRRPQPSIEELRQRREAIKRAHNQGHSIEELMAMFDLPRDMVRRDLYSPSDNTPHHVRIRREKIQHIFDQGFHTASVIAPRLWPNREITVADHNMVRSDLRAMGLDGVYKQELQERRERVEQLHNEGLSFNEVIERSGFTTSQVRADYRLLGLPLPNDLLAQRREEVRRMRSEGLSSGVIADRLGLPMQVVGDDIRVLVRDGALADDARVTLTRKKQRAADRRARIVELYPTGMPIDAIAEELDVSSSTITSDVTLLKRQGVLHGRTNGSPRMGVPKANTIGTNTISMTDNAITHMGQMADVLLGSDLTDLGAATPEQWATWEKALKRVKRAVTYVRRNQPNNQGE